MVGERAVQFEVHGDDVERKSLEDGGDGVAAHAVARVDHDLQRADGRQVDQGPQVGRVVGEGVAVRDGAGRGDRVRYALFGPLLDQGADLGEPAVLPDRCGARPAQLDAVVLRRVVRGGEHRPGQAEAAGGEVQLVGGAEADQGDVRTACRRAARERRREAGRRRAHVVADHDRLRIRHLDERRPELLGQRFVPLVGHDSAHVVRLHDLRQISSHGPVLLSFLRTAQTTRPVRAPAGGCGRSVIVRFRSRASAGPAGDRGARPPSGPRCAGRRLWPPPRVRADAPPPARRWRVLRGRHRWGAWAQRDR